jgi:hypothetical protein
MVKDKIVGFSEATLMLSVDTIVYYLFANPYTTGVSQCCTA